MSKHVKECAVDALYEELFRIGKHLHDPVPIDPKAIIRKHLAAAQQGQEAAIEQVRAARREMECSIRESVSEAMKTFYEKTGMYPHSIYVDLADVGLIGGREKRVVVDEVRAEVSL
jgi:hypothetical protein